MECNICGTDNSKYECAHRRKEMSIEERKLYTDLIDLNLFFNTNNNAVILSNMLEQIRKNIESAETTKATKWWVDIESKLNALCGTINNVLEDANRKCSEMSVSVLKK